MSSLGEIYDRHKNIFSQKPLINIDKSNNNTRFGRINIVENMPVSQLVAQLVKDLRLPLDQDAASNLYTGIISKYGSVTIDAVDPQALDVLSFLGRLKAQNLTNKSTPTNQQVSDQSQQRNQQGDIQVQSSDNQLGNVDHDVEDQTPEDWLKPKIFTTNKQGGN
ncbi:MAG: hypothetical protein UU81_C0027G0015 [Microgenomates group bacterium GW2011_GWC1_41_8]|nr:MAG: hypothetical protein UU81_C0027G0015 [Microgenomates group bacterium GW2011_GWC1_41_8]